MGNSQQKSAGESGQLPRPPPAPDEIRAQLARIIAGAAFEVSERARAFLRYVVEETLAGRTDRLKAYTIGVAVFERDEGFDSQADPVVRIEAGRLRRALERYYLVAGQGDPVLIEIPNRPLTNSASADSLPP
jgi:adenylate cyclase